MEAQIAYWIFNRNAREPINKIRMSPGKLPNFLESLHNSLSQVHNEPDDPDTVDSIQSDFAVKSEQSLATYCNPESEMVSFIIISEIVSISIILII